MCTKEFNDIYYRYHPEVYAYVQKKTRCTFMAEEVVQLTFIKFWNYNKIANESIELRTQIFQIAKTTLVDQLRKKYSKKNSFYLGPILNDRNLGVPSYEVINGINHKDTKARLENLLRDLPPVRKKVFELSRFEEFTHKEISNLLNISTKTVENHINQALRYIRVYWCVFLIIYFSGGI